MLRTLGQPLVIHDVERCQRRGAGNRVAAVGAAVRPGRQTIEKLARGQDSGQRQARGDPLGHDHDVRRRIGPFGCEESAGPRVAGLHFVDGEQDPVAVGQLAQCGQEAVGRHDIATLAEHGLDHERGHVIRRHASS